LTAENARTLLTTIDGLPNPERAELMLTPRSGGESTAASPRGLTFPARRPIDEESIWRKRIAGVLLLAGLLCFVRRTPYAGQSDHRPEWQSLTASINLHGNSDTSPIAPSFRVVRTGTIASFN
jgi:hypothetical protein